MPCGFYNCHGMTFASRRARIWELKEISKVLAEDNYREVEKASTLPGDIVIYYCKGDAQHSGVVIDSPDGVANEMNFKGETE